MSADSTAYVTLMFGLGLATPEQVVAGIGEHQGYVVTDNGCRKLTGP